MRVFLDTNVLVSAFTTHGLRADLLRQVTGKHEVCVSEQVIDELRRALREKFGMPAGVAELFVEYTREHHVVPTPDSNAARMVRDPADRTILAAAVAAPADVLVTGDRDLLDLGSDAPLPIVSPRGFWEMLRMRSEPGG